MLSSPVVIIILVPSTCTNPNTTPFSPSPPFSTTLRLSRLECNRLKHNWMDHALLRYNHLPRNWFWGVTCRHFGHLDRISES
ncbi:uncharacterized protein K444DRAFT_325318 [Hyaloscypha bicolor E]|uniref:Uncharacterized protein n=1 Tax=Hyaloscypha bicolor E TaxID=1095630 RepID=A0A2J6TKX7_9HELO|nr:uncharacterized protein K444DRAFT_325318 [Hyaloscypha bicolor E]PMD63670.1 hypothetical protein K444DRAFT_325318 [Hyaloscypha bicolor E]